MTIDHLVAYCGVNCAGCPDYAGGKCSGCRDTVWDDDPCPPVRCCREKGIEVCGACDPFPCDMMAEFYEESEGHKEAYRRMRAMRTERTE